MSLTRIFTAAGCCLVVTTALAQSPIKQKPGLWEVTTQMSMGGQSAPQMPQMPAGMQMPPGMKMPASPYGAHTSQVCITQAMIDKYGSPYSNPPNSECKVTDISIKSNGMTANLVCTGRLTGTGTVEASWTEPEATKSKVHMSGTMSTGNGSMPIDMTMNSTSVYKGSDCGSVKPATLPDGK